MLSALNRLIPGFARRVNAANESSNRQVPQTPALTEHHDESDACSESWQTLNESDLKQGERLSQRQSSNSSTTGKSKPQRLISDAILQFRFRHRDEFVVDEDISKGREFHKIPAVSYKRNDQAPSDFHYVTEHVQFEPIHVDTSLKGINCCDCQGECNSRCTCSSNLSSGLSYDSKGRLAPSYNLDAPEVIFECNAACKCNKKTCKNAVIQAGPRCKLVLFRTKSRGWGVRSLETLKRGTFVGVYSGELISALESQRREDDTYLFNLATTNIYYQTPAANESSERQQTDDQAEGEQHQVETFEQDSSKQQFVCDAKNFGNVTRFINHSCEPNVIGIRSFTTHQDPRFPYIAFFTCREVPANSELLLNYGDNYWLVKCRRDKVYCLCKKPSCRLNKRTFPETLRKLNKQRREQKDTTADQ